MHTWGREEHDVLDLAVLVERPLAARIAVDDRAVLAFVPVRAIGAGGIS